MRKNFKKSIIVLTLLLMLTLTACGSKSTFGSGSFEGKVFTNEWTNMKFVFPDDYVVASQEEIDEMMKNGNAMMYSDDEEMEKAMSKVVDLKLVYDFLISSPDNTINYQMFYENLALSAGATKYSEKEYLDASMEPVLANSELGYEILNEGTKTIAGKEFYYYALTGYGGVVRQDMYCFKLENRMIVFTVTCAPGNESAANEIFNNITAIK